MLCMTAGHSGAGMAQARPRDCNDARTRDHSVATAVPTRRAVDGERRLAKQTQTEKPSRFNATVTNRVYGGLRKPEPGHVPPDSDRQNQAENINHFNALPYPSTFSAPPARHRLVTAQPA